MQKSKTKMSSIQNGPTTANMASQLYLYLSTCSKAWLCIYLFFCVLMALTSPMLHVMVVGLFLCAISYFRLPPPDPTDAFKILGCDPRNLDGTPSKTRGALGLIAHRGACLDAPENSLEGVRLAKKNGAKCIEFDVQLTADGQAVVFHDAEVDRVTNGSGDLSQMTLKQVRSLDLAAKHVLKEQFSPCRIPTLEEFVDECLKLDLKMIIDLKPLESTEKTAELITDLYKQKPQLYTSAMTSSFHPNLLYAIRQKDSRICCSMAWRPHYFAYKNYSGVSKEMARRFSSPFQHHLAILADYIGEWLYHEFMWYFLGLSAVLVIKDVLTAGYVQKWRERGVRLIAWTVNNSLERVYLERVLHITCMSDTMDEIGIENILK